MSWRMQESGINQSQGFQVCYILMLIFVYLLMTITDDGTRIDNNGIMFNDDSITLESALTGIDLNSYFIFELDLTTNASDGSYTITDFRQSIQFSTPMIAIGTNWDT